MINAVKTYFRQINYLLLVKILLLGLLVAILTFPNYSLIYSTGIDPSLIWIFNSLFAEGSTLAKEFIFPHGPLAFFMYPLTENIILVMLVTILFKILLLFNVKVQLKGKDEKTWLIAFVVTYFLCLISGFTHLLLVNILLLLLNYYRSKKSFFKYLAFFITAFAFYVKSYVAIVSGMLCVSFVVLEFFQNYKWKTSLKDAAVILGFMFLFWIMLFHSFTGFFKAIYGMMQLAGDNSSAVAYYPVNNWWFLGVFFLSILSLVLLNRSKDAYIYWGIIGLSLFGAWKHGIAREDGTHMEGMWSYLIIVFSIYLLFVQKNRLQNIIIAIVAITFFGANMRNVEGYSSSGYELFRANNFFHFIGNYSKIVTDANKINEKNIAINKLPHSIVEKVGNKTVDIYPWDYSIIPANNLNWKPRPILHSYAAYTSWLDEQNARHISSDQSADCIIWKVEKNLPGLNGNNWNSIDNRYLLNDEPQTILSFISNYHFKHEENGFLLFEKDSKKSKIHRKIVKSSKIAWNKWLKVPKRNASLLRAKVDIHKSLPLKIKSALYKDEQYWVDFKFEDQSIHHYRFVPKNAQDGLWINPYIYDLNTSFEIDEIRFRSSNSNLLSSEINVSWEAINIDKVRDISTYFQQTSKREMKLHASIEYDFSKSKLNQLESISQIIHTVELNDEHQTLDTNQMSDIITLSLDSLTGSFKATFGCSVKADRYAYTNKILIIIALHKGGESLLWNGVSVDKQLIAQEDWNWVLNHQSFNATEPGYEIRVSIWNTSNHPVQVDNFKLHLYQLQ